MQAWTPQEDEMIRQHYTSGGSAAVLPMLPWRTERMIRGRAFRLGVQSERAEPAVVLPAMTLTEQLECVRFRKWAAPVFNRGLLTWRFA